MTGTDPGPDAAEIVRIRAAYRERDRRGARGPAIAAAYRLVNAERLVRMGALIESIAGPAPRLLDVGCGGGHDLASYEARGWPAERMAGVDLVADRIAAARELCPGVDLRVTDGATLPFPAASFDVATAVTTFSSILDIGLRRALFAEMDRVVRPGGSILVYDFVIRNPTNPDVIAMTGARLRDLGRAPDASTRLTPLIQAVALGALLGPQGAHLAANVAPRTHRLSRWVVEGGPT